MNAKSRRSSSPALRRLPGAMLSAVVAAALLTATACGPADGDGAAAPSIPASADANGPSGTGPSDASDAGNGTGTAESGDSGETSGGNGTRYADCEASELNTAVELQDGPDETPRHFLLTVTNGTRTPCVLNEAPQVRLLAGNDAAIVEPLGEPDSEPVVVEGGGKAYAGLYVFGNDEGGEAMYDRSDRFTATLIAGEGTELNGTLIFDLPDDLHSVSVDDAARVNGWAGTEGMAMRPINLL